MTWFTSDLRKYLDWNVSVLCCIFGDVTKASVIRFHVLQGNVSMTTRSMSIGVGSSCPFVDWLLWFGVWFGMEVWRTILPCYHICLHMHWILIIQLNLVVLRVKCVFKQFVLTCGSHGLCVTSINSFGLVGCNLGEVYHNIYWKFVHPCCVSRQFSSKAVNNTIFHCLFCPKNSSCWVWILMMHLG